MTLDGRTVRMMLAYKRWANRVVYGSLEGLAAEELIKPRPTAFGNILGTLHHVFIVDDIFRHHLMGRAHGYVSRGSDTPPALPALRAAVTEMDDWYVETAAGWTEAEMDEAVRFTYVGGGAGVMTRAEMALHVVNHATYHRGFVGDMLRQVPFAWPANDLSVFLRDGVG